MTSNIEDLLDQLIKLMKKQLQSITDQTEILNTISEDLTEIRDNLPIKDF